MPTLQKKTATKKSATKPATKPARKAPAMGKAAAKPQAAAKPGAAAKPEAVAKSKTIVKPKAAVKSAPATSAGAAKLKAAVKPSVSKGTPSMRVAAQAPAPSTLVAVGAKAPDFTLPDASGKLVTLSAFKGKPVVVYFYPKDDTSGCTQEACDFRDNLAAFRKSGCTVLGISPDSVKSHAKFAAKHALTLTLLADEPEADGTPAVCARYGVWQEKSMYGRAYMGVVRTTYLIGPDGKVAHRFDKVSVTGHVDEVLAAVRALA